mgnify:CR=1 FL=1
MKRRVVAALLAAGLFAAGCSGDDDIETAVVNPATDAGAVTSAAGSDTTIPTGDTSGDTSGGESPLPRVRVRDLASGQLVDLSTLLPGDKPLAIWFWAPY